MYSCLKEMNIDVLFLESIVPIGVNFLNVEYFLSRYQKYYTYDISIPSGQREMYNNGSLQLLEAHLDSGNGRRLIVLTNVLADALLNYNTITIGTKDSSYIHSLDIFSDFLIFDYDIRYGDGCESSEILECLFKCEIMSNIWYNSNGIDCMFVVGYLLEFSIMVVLDGLEKCILDVSTELGRSISLGDINLYSLNNKLINKKFNLKYRFRILELENYVDLIGWNLDNLDVKLFWDVVCNINLNIGMLDGCLVETREFIKCKSNGVIKYQLFNNQLLSYNHIQLFNKY
jgi:hypothetical protein